MFIFELDVIIAPAASVGPSRPSVPAERIAHGFFLL